MYRIALGVEYVGTNYKGWQRQINQPELACVQVELERAVSDVANKSVKVFCAGRTDAGVHASGQVVHYDVDVERSERQWVFGCNSKLPQDIRVLWAKVVPEEFDARKSAICRKYQYIIYNNPIRASLLHEYASWHYIQLNAEKMHLAAQNWVGVHDFSSFRASGCQSTSPVRDLKAITIKRRGELIIFDILANAFLYHMVRNMVGTLCAIGSGSKLIGWSKDVLLAKDRTKAGITAPPHGLYLAGVCYPARLQIPENKSGLWIFNQG